MIQFRDRVIASRPVGYWPCETRGTADTLPDLSGNGLHGSSIGSSASQTGPVIRNGYQASGGITVSASETGTIPDHALLDIAGPVSVMASFRQPSPATVYGSIFAKSAATVSARQEHPYHLWWNSTAEVLLWSIGDGVTFTQVNLNTISKLFIDDRSHLVIGTADQTTAIGYVDGIRAASAASTLVPVVNNLPVTIGRGAAVATGCRISHVAIWNRALSENDVRNLYKAWMGSAA